VLRIEYYNIKQEQNMLRKLIAILVILSGQGVAYAGNVSPKADTIPANVLGNFMDDYGIRYTVTDTLFTQHPNVKYHIISWNTAEQYLLARNDDKNPSEKGLYTRIDYMSFSNMEPFLWGFCLTTYNATSVKEARDKARADRQNPRKGCNGYPFSRMKRTE
jgi:hypothetical protein